MNLRLQFGEISLPKDFRFDITANHPFFSSEGSSSTPTTIPATPDNRRLLGNPENHNAANRYSRHLQAILSHGVFSKRCRLIVDSASQTGGITAALALEESEMYAEHQDKKLRDIITNSFQRVAPPDITGWLNSLYTSMSGDYVFLKVAADAEDADSADSTGSTRKASVVLNETVTSSGTTNMKMSGYTMKVDNGNGGKSTISLPSYYGLTPFLKLHALIRKTFEALGYTVKENTFATDAALSKIVVLHNTADSMVSFLKQYVNGAYFIAAIPYNDMVPSITVGDLITWLHDKFGAFVSVRNNEVRIRLLRDILTASYDLDLSKYLRDEVTVQHPEPVMLRTGCQHEIEGSEPAAETLEDLREAYSSLVTCFNVSEAEGVGLFHVLPLGKFYFRNQAGDGLVKVGSDGFDCYREMGVDSEEITSEDLFVPMILHNGEYMPYIGETVRRHIDINDKDAEAEQKIMICYCKNNGRNYGTLYNYSPTGSETTPVTPDLIPEALTSEYWETYRRLRLDGAPTLTAKLDIPLYLLSSMDICTPKLFQGSKVLIQSIKYSITNSGASFCEVTLMRIKEAADGEAITDPAFGSNLVWQYVNTRKTFTNVTGSGRKRNGKEVTGTDGLTDYDPVTDQPGYTPGHPGIIDKKRSRWLNYTVYQFQSGGWFLWYWESSSSWGGKETYYEYFISKNR